MNLAIFIGFDFSIQTFQDPDESEVFYTSAWGILGDNPIIAFAGEHGSIRILSIINTQVFGLLKRLN